MNDQKGKQIAAHLKVWLLQGKTISSNEALRLWKTSRLAVYVNRLRNSGLRIKTKMVTENGDTFAVYSLEVTEKIDRISTRAYMEQA